LFDLGQMASCLPLLINLMASVESGKPRLCAGTTGDALRFLLLAVAAVAL